MSASAQNRAIDPATWSRAAQFDLFRAYERPHFSVVSRLDVTHLVDILKPKGVSPYRACLFAFGTAINAVPALRTRFRGDTVTEFGAIDLSMTVPKDDGTFAYGYLPFEPDWTRFDAACGEAVADALAGNTAANKGQRLDLAYLSCLPWLDFTGITNAMTNAQDCIPRIAWGRFAEIPEGRHSVAVAIEVHHAVADGIHVARFFQEAQQTLDTL